MPDALCWDCKNAVPGIQKGCPWSREFKPVKGWSAERRDLEINRCRDGRIESYLVLGCPLFDKG